MLRCLARAEKLAESMLRVQAMEWPLLVSQQTLTELATIVTLRQQLEEKKNKASTYLYMLGSVKLLACTLG